MQILRIIKAYFENSKFKKTFITLRRLEVLFNWAYSVLLIFCLKIWKDSGSVPYIFWFDGNHTSVVSGDWISAACFTCGVLLRTESITSATFPGKYLSSLVLGRQLHQAYSLPNKYSLQGRTSEIELRAGTQKSYAFLKSHYQESLVEQLWVSNKAEIWTLTLSSKENRSIMDCTPSSPTPSFSTVDRGSPCELSQQNSSSHSKKSQLLRTLLTHIRTNSWKRKNGYLKKAHKALGQSHGFCTCMFISMKTAINYP